MLNVLRAVPRTLIPSLVGVALCCVGASAARRGTAVAPIEARVSPPSDAVSCPARTLPDEGMCVPLPDGEAGGAPEPAEESNAHHDTRGKWVLYDEIPRRPDRAADYDAYRYPVPCDRNCVISGFDLDLPDGEQRRGRHLSHVGHGAVDLPQKRGTAVTVVALEFQHGDAEVIYVGPLFGTTVITRHTVEEAGRPREYLVLFAHLDAPSPGMRPGVMAKEGDIVGFVGDSGSPNLVHLHLEVRRVRSGVDPAKLSSSAMIANENSVVCDPRNVLPLKRPL